MSISLLSLLLNTKRVLVKLVARTFPALTLPDTFAAPVIPNSVPLNVKLALSTNLPPVSANTTRVLVKLLALMLPEIIEPVALRMLPVTVKLLLPESNVKFALAFRSLEPVALN